VRQHQEALKIVGIVDDIIMVMRAACRQATVSKGIGELANSSNPRHGSFNFFNKPGIDLFVHNYSFLIYADKMN